MAVLGLPGVSFGGVSRRARWTASGRSEYQMGIEVHNGGPARKHRSGHTVDHRAHWLLLPDDADPLVWTRAMVWTGAGRAEKRKDAREARYFDISWPRELPTDQIDGFVRNLYSPFTQMGLVVQTDWETSRASDGKPNDHLHGLISTRVLTDVGFAAEKCRALDVWFRAGVRRQVAALFDAIAKDCGIEVEFDPRMNAEREHTLPPEIRLPRRIVRNPTSPGAEVRISQRDAHRAARREHQEVIVKMEALEKRVANLQELIEVELDGLAILTSLQSTSTAEPLPVAVTTFAFMAASITTDDCLAAEGIGVAVVIGGTVLIDVGARIQIEGERHDDAATALHVLAGHKGWRDLGLVDGFGMPMPVPPAPARAFQTFSSSIRERSGIELSGKCSLGGAAQEIVRLARSDDPASRVEMMDRVATHGDRRLVRVVDELIGHAGTPEKISTQAVLDMIDRVMGRDDDIWRRYALEQNLQAMTLPATPLSRPFRPNPRFYEIYNISPNGSVIPGDLSSREREARQ